MIAEPTVYLSLGHKVEHKQVESNNFLLHEEAPKPLLVFHKNMNCAGLER